MPDIGGGKPGSPSGPSVSTAQIVSEAASFFGVPYVYGGTSPTGFDCSGLVQYVFGHFGITLPRTSEAQYTVGTSVAYKDLLPGDLVFSDWGDGTASHVAIYAGGGKLIEAPHTGEDVHQIALDSSYQSHVDGYRRVSGIAETLKGSDNPVASAIGGAEGAVNSLLSFPAEITGFFSGATSDLSDIAGWFGAFFQPSTYVRIGAGLLGGIALVAGVVFLILAAGDPS